MRKALILSCAAMLFSGSLSAGINDLGPAAMIYIQMPFGTGATETPTRLGFTFDYADSADDTTVGNPFSADHLGNDAFLDVHLNLLGDGGLESITINGLRMFKPAIEYSVERILSLRKAH
jgi:hypothetical protein